MIKEYYNVFNTEDVKKINQTLSSSQWKFGQVSDVYNPYQKYKKFWKMDLDNDTFFSEVLFKKIEKIIDKKCYLERVYANGQTYGLDGSWHIDTDKSDGYTFLYYANNIWDPLWGGETIFSIENKIISYIPVPNKAICFPGSIHHYAKSPSRDCYDLRVTLAYKIRISKIGLTGG